MEIKQLTFEQLTSGRKSSEILKFHEINGNGCTAKVMGYKKAVPRDNAYITKKRKKKEKYVSKS